MCLYVCVGCVRVFGVYEGVVCVRGYVGCTRGCVMFVTCVCVCDVCVCVSCVCVTCVCV